jgi:hypothetical protein
LTVVGLVAFYSEYPTFAYPISRYNQLSMHVHNSDVNFDKVNNAFRVILALHLNYTELPETLVVLLLNVLFHVFEYLDFP